MDNLTLTHLINEVIKNKFRVGRMYQYNVDITHINSPDSFYVRPIVFKYFMSRLELPGEPITRDSEIDEGNIIIYMSEVLKKKARGRVVSVEITDVMKCKIFAVDEGFFETVIWYEQNMWFPLQTIEVPPLIKHCKLAYRQSSSNKWSEAAIQAFKDCVAYTAVRVMVHEITSDTCSVEITDPPYIITHLSRIRRLYA